MFIRNWASSNEGLFAGRGGLAMGGVMSSWARLSPFGVSATPPRRSAKLLGPGGLTTVMEGEGLTILSCLAMASSTEGGLRGFSKTRGV